MTEIMEANKFCNYISSLAIKSILYEVASAPKPGLVDRINRGAHDDMDIFTFLSSSSVLFPYFYTCTQKGIDFQGLDYRQLMDELRSAGMEAEKGMFQATSGINTHKGVIFSFGVICASVGSLFQESNNIYFKSRDLLARVKEMTRGISLELEDARGKKDLTYGEKLYMEYGVRGIRGEVESGFATVIDHSLPILEELLTRGDYQINDVLVHTLLYLIKNTEDSNILGRHGLEGLNYAQERAGEAIRLGGYLTPQGRLAVEEMDKDFIDKNISPGGAADLLGVSLLIYYLQHGDRG